MIEYLKKQGLDAKTISTIVIMLATFLTIFGLVVIGLAVYETVLGIAIAPWVAGVLFGLSTFAINIISSFNVAKTIDGAASTAGTAAASGFVAAHNAAMATAATATLLEQHGVTLPTSQPTEGEKST